MFFKNAEPTWDDKCIITAEHIEKFIFKFHFQDGSVKILDLAPYIRRNAKIFKRMIENEEIAGMVQVEPMGTGIFWDDLMGMEAQTIYDLPGNNGPGNQPKDQN